MVKTKLVLEKRSVATTSRVHSQVHGKKYMIQLHDYIIHN